MNAFSKFVTSRPWLVLALLLGTTVVLAMGFSKLETRNNQDSELPDDDPIVETNDRLDAVFGDKTIVLLAIESDDVFTPSTLAKVDSISEALRDVSGVINDEVTSLTTVNNITGREWGLEVGTFIEEVPTTEAEIQRLRQDVRENPLIYGQLVSKDETLTLVQANVREGYDQEATHADAYALAEKYTGPEKVYVAGDAIQPQEIDKGVQEDMAMLLPLVLGLILVGFYISFGTVRGVLLPFSVAALSVVWTMGAMGLIGFPITVVSSTIPILLVAVSSSYGIHVVHRYYEEALHGDREEATRKATKKIGPAVVMTGLTSALGSATLIIFRVTSIREFGMIAAIGVLFTLVLTMTLIPAVLALLKKQAPKRSHDGSGAFDRILSAMGRFAIQRRYTVIAASVVLLVVSAVGVSQIRVGNDFVEYFPEDHRLRTTFETLNDKLGGARFIDVMIDGGEEDAVKNPELLKDIRQFQEFATSHEEVGRTNSFVNVIRRIHQVMQGGGEEHYAVPDSRDLVAQYLLLYSMSGDPADFADLVDYDYQRAKVRIMLTTSDQEDHERIYNALQDYAGEHFEGPVRAEFGGDVMFWLAQIKYIVQGKILNIVLALAVVLLLCMIAFRSFSAGLLSVAPLAVSTLMTFGLMGFIGIRLETGTAIITAIAVGIGVDFALHFLARFRQEMEDEGDVQASTVLTMRSAGKAISYDVLSNVIGFCAFIFSGFLPVQYFGWLISLTMITVGLSTFLLMPALISVFRPSFLEPTVAAPTSSESIQPATAMSSFTHWFIVVALSGGLLGGVLMAPSTHAQPAPAEPALTNPASPPTASTHPAPTAREIMERFDAQDSADDERVDFEMKLINKKGDERSRKVRQTLMTDDDGQRRALIRFLEPGDVRGTGLLTIEHEDRDDDQWLYLPALRRTRRISPANQTDRFMGSDFTYEDVQSEDLEAFDYSLVRTDTLEGTAAYVVEAVPATDEKREESGYAKRHLWIDAETFVNHKIHFFNDDGDQIKTFTATEFKKVEGSDKWRAHRMEMDHQVNEHRTVLLYDNYEVNQGIDDDVFSRRFLKRGAR